MGIETARKHEVLLVESDELMARMIARVLRSAHAVSVVSSVDEALRRLDRAEPFAAVVCSLALPVRSGVELYQEVARRDASTAQRFVFITEGSFSRDVDFLESVDNPRVEKAFIPDHLHRLMATVVGRD